jgi:hypothetical protein
MALLQKLTYAMIGHDFEDYNTELPDVQRLVCIRCGQVFARHIDFGILPYGQAKKKFRDRYT